MSDLSARTPRIVVAGASGFIGRALPDVLADDFELVGLSRAPRRAARQSPDAYRWRRCDLFSRQEAFQALRGADIGVYLVHSMLPSADLSQGSFADMDVICADNFARAAAHHDVEHLVYVSALLPRDDIPSKTLWRRGDIEHVLRSRQIPVTTLRAGFVVGPGGPATEMLFRLVERLPVMLLPRWTSSKVSPIARRDLVELIGVALRDRDASIGSFDVGGPATTTYRLMLATVADVLGLERRFFRVPFDTPALSSRWISTVTGQPHAIVWPLVERFRHDLLPEERRFQKMAGQRPRSLRRALQAARTAPEPSGETAPPIPVTDQDQFPVPAEAINVVRSVHRLPLPAGRTTRWVADEYARWLPRFLGPLLRSSTHDGVLHFHLGPLPMPLLTLVLDEDASRTDRQLFWIRGGILSAHHPQARLEFRRIPDRPAVLTAIHHYRPRLPWWLYLITQAPFHHLVMRAFDRHLTCLSLPD